MRFEDKLYGYTPEQDRKLLVSQSEGKVKGLQRRTTIIGAVHLIMFDVCARKRVIEADTVPTTYTDQMHAVTGRTYTLEKSDLSMMHSLLTDDQNRGLFFPENASKEETAERAQVITIIAEQASALGAKILVEK
jgi:hypothetical protein